MLVTIFVRHSEDCKYKGDEFEKRCRCRKHLRWTQNGKQHRRMAGTRTWSEAEQAKRNLEDQLNGKAVEPEKNPTRFIPDAIELFLQDKQVQGITAGRLAKFKRELERLKKFCEHQSVFTVQGITRDLLTGYCATWEKLYPSSQTRAAVLARTRNFLAYCFHSEWITRIPLLPKIKVDEPPTMPLTGAEYTRLLDAVDKLHKDDPEKRGRVRAAFQLMRWTGLAIGDALTLERDEIQHDPAKALYRVVTSRQKTGTHVSVPIPPEVAEELLKAANGNPRYVFTNGEDAEVVTKSWRKYFIAPAFAAARIKKAGNMMSHRLRDTFAVDLLEKGVPLEEVSKLLGHESIRTTEKSYAKWVKGRQDRLDSLVVGTWK